MLNVSSGQNFGFGVRVLVNGTWGFAASPLVTADEVQRVTKEAVDIAKANAPYQKKKIDLVPTPNPVNSPLQVDLTDTRQWRQALREQYEGKFPGRAPRTSEGKPDLSGVWIAEGTP